MIQLTEAQREEIQKGQPVTMAEEGLGKVVVLAEALYLEMCDLLKEAEDKREQDAFLRASHASAVAAMKDNPY